MVKDPCAKAGDVGSIPGPEDSACHGELRLWATAAEPTCPSPCTATGEATTMRNRSTTRGSPRTATKTRDSQNKYLRKKNQTLLNNTKISSTQNGKFTMSGIQQKTTRYRKVWKCKERNPSPETNPATTQTAKLRDSALSRPSSKLGVTALSTERVLGRHGAGSRGHWRTAHRRQSQTEAEEPQCNTWRENCPTEFHTQQKCFKNKGKTKIFFRYTKAERIHHQQTWL